MRGTPGYIAPEWRQAKVTIKAGIYSFGIILLENDQSRRPSMSIVVKVLQGLTEVDTNINYNFTYATTSSSTVNKHASTAPPASVLSNP
ncbi:hypothetical protein CsSME_00028178 [Camellia sinensis var. sinensis]